jgi:hypothetical protein
MLTTAKLFQLLNEAIVLLLGALLILLAVSGRAGLPTRPAALIALGVVFIYWGASAWIRPEPRVSSRCFWTLPGACWSYAGFSASCYLLEVGECGRKHERIFRGDEKRGFVLGKSARFQIMSAIGSVLLV